MHIVPLQTGLCEVVQMKGHNKHLKLERSSDILFISGPEVIKLIFMLSSFFLLIIDKMPTIVGILTFLSRKNSVLGLYDPEKCWIS